MNNKISILNWSLATLSVGAIYLYVATIWIQAGYYSYFGLPTNFISFSIKENSLFFHLLVEAGLIAIIKMHWYIWIVVIGASLLGYLYSKIKIAIYCFLLVFVCLFLWKTVGLGETIAKNQATYFTLSKDCIVTGTSTKYFIPDFYNDKAILISYTIDENSHKKMGNGFIVKDLTQIQCEIFRDYSFGVIEK